MQCNFHSEIKAFLEANGVRFANREDTLLAKHASCICQIETLWVNGALLKGRRNGQSFQLTGVGGKRLQKKAEKWPYLMIVCTLQERVLGDLRLVGNDGPMRKYEHQRWV